MKITKIIVLFLFFSQIMFGQFGRPQVRWGEELTQPTNSYLDKIIANTPEGMYALRIKESGIVESGKVFLELYNQSMNLKKAKELELDYNGKTRKFEQIIKLGEDFYFITSFHNEAKKKNYLFQQKINKEQLSVSDRSIQLIGEFETKSVLKTGAFDIVQSKDSSRVLVFHQLPYKKGNAKKFRLRVFDDSFQQLWDKEITLPYNEEIFSVEEYQVDSKGNVYMLGIIYQDKSKERRLGKPNYQYVILAYTEGGFVQDEYRIALKDDFITDLTFRVANNGDLVCTGFYSQKGTSSVKGTYFFRIDARTKEIYNQNQKSFDFDFLTEFYTEKQKQRARNAERQGNVNQQPELYKFALNDLILRSDGGALLVAEQYYIYQRSYRDFWYGTFRYDYFYHYNDIIVVNIRPDGEIDWATRIPKQQITVNDGGYYSSYAMSIVRDKIYLIFNDSSRNFSEGNRNRIYNYDGRNSVVALTEISIDGTWDIKPLFQNREVDLVTRPKVCQQIERRAMVIYGELGRSFRFAKLDFDEFN